MAMDIMKYVDDVLQPALHDAFDEKAYDRRDRSRWGGHYNWDNDWRTLRSFIAGNLRSIKTPDDIVKYTKGGRFDWPGGKFGVGRSDNEADAILAEVVNATKSVFEEGTSDEPNPDEPVPAPVVPPKGGAGKAPAPTPGGQDSSQSGNGVQPPKPDGGGAENGGPPEVAGGIHDRYVKGANVILGKMNDSMKMLYQAWMTRNLAKNAPWTFDYMVKRLGLDRDKRWAKLIAWVRQDGSDGGAAGQGAGVEAGGAGSGGGLTGSLGQEGAVNLDLGVLRQKLANLPGTKNGITGAIRGWTEKDVNMIYNVADSHKDGNITSILKDINFDGWWGDEQKKELATRNILMGSISKQADQTTSTTPTKPGEPTSVPSGGETGDTKGTTKEDSKEQPETGHGGTGDGGDLEAKRREVTETARKTNASRGSGARGASGGDLLPKSKPESEWKGGYVEGLKFASRYS
jgi:hypothetical protein